MPNNKALSYYLTILLILTDLASFTKLNNLNFHALSR